MFQQKKARIVILMVIVGVMVLLISQLATVFAHPDFSQVFVSTKTAGSVDGVDFDPNDILLWEDSSGTWSKFFDGSDHELDSAKHNINAIWLLQTTISTTEIYMSFFQNKVIVDGLGQVTGHEVIKLTDVLSPSHSYTYTRYFNASDFGLTEVSEKIDGLEIYPFFYNGCESVVLISTFGEYLIPAKYTDDGAVKLKGEGSDVLFFCVTEGGPDEVVDGVWARVFDGSEEGMPKNYVDSLTAIENLCHGWFTTPGPFALDSAVGGPSEVYTFECDGFSGPYFSAPDEGLTEFVDALHLPVDLP